MSESVPTDVAPAAPAEAVVAAPAPEVVVVTPASEPIVEPIVETPAPEAPKPEASLLEQAGKDEPKPAEPEKPVEVAPPQPEPPKAYEPFVLPEGLTAEPEKLAAFSDIASKHGIDQATAQSLVDMHTAQLTAFAEGLRAEQQRAWGETKAGWRTAAMADPEIGGAGHQTAMTAIARMRDMLVPEQHRAAFTQMLNDTGTGNHPEMLRLLHNAARVFDEPGMPAAAYKPPTNNGKPPGRQGIRGLYDSHAMGEVRK